MPKNLNLNIPSRAAMRASILTLAMSQETRDILDKLDLDEQRSVDTLGRLLNAGAVGSDQMTRLIGKLQDKGARPSAGALDELAKAVRGKPVQGRAALAFRTP